MRITRLRASSASTRSACREKPQTRLVSLVSMMLGRRLASARSTCVLLRIAVNRPSCVRPSRRPSLLRSKWVYIRVRHTDNYTSQSIVNRSALSKQLHNYHYGQNCACRWLRRSSSPTQALSKLELTLTQTSPRRFSKSFLRPRSTKF